MVDRVASTSAAAHTVCGGGRSRGAEKVVGAGAEEQKKKREVY